MSVNYEQLNTPLYTQNEHALETEAFDSLSAPVLSNLDRLENEAVDILWETWAALNNSAIMFSGGKDSATIVHLVKIAFTRISGEHSIPFPLIHFDSNANFPEVISYKESLVKELGANLITYHVAQANPAQDKHGNIKELIQLINNSVKELSLDGLIGGGRRDEELVRAKERIFSVRNNQGRWEPHNQRPEPWGLYNTSLSENEHFRIFPISNWTELNVWEYIAREGISLPSIYYAHEREVVLRKGSWFAVFEDTELYGGEKIEVKTVRCRTAGDRHTTGFIESKARTPLDVMNEIRLTCFSERAGRKEDRSPGIDMESRKRLGWP